MQNSLTPIRRKNSSWKHGPSKTDGSTTTKVGGVGVVLISPEKEVLKCVDRLQFSATNNKGEYKALLIGLSLAKALGVKNLVVQVDS